MAKFNIIRAYIDAEDGNDNHNIEIYVKERKKMILVGKSKCTPRKWLYTLENEDGDLVINNSAGMEEDKWDHLVKEIIGEENGRTDQ
jgi:hypothetical protein